MSPFHLNRFWLLALYKPILQVTACPCLCVCPDAGAHKSKLAHAHSEVLKQEQLQSVQRLGRIIYQPWQ